MEPEISREMEGQEDPIVHFYETFLAQYDPKLRELRGVYYTPEPVVSYIVRSVDYLLREQFDLPDGLADTATATRTTTDENGETQSERSPRVLILDPACGTGIFSYAIVDLIRETYRQTGNAGMWSSYVRDHLLPRLFGFELLMAPYAVAHLKLGMQLAALDLPKEERAAWAYDFASDERLGIFLTNTLEQALVRSRLRRPNISPAFITDISGKLTMQFVVDGKGDLQQTFGPEDVFHYMYAVFHSPAYRTRYAEFLKIDFPRLPLTTHVDLFRALCKLGERLVGLHLMEKFGTTILKYPVNGNNVVEKIEYLEPSDHPEQGRVSTNKTQYFAGVPPDVWNFHVGGCQVCHKWLKDRKGRTLTFDDLKHYQRIVAALAETITLMERIDEAIGEHGGWPLV